MSVLDLNIYAASLSLSHAHTNFKQDTCAMIVHEFKLLKFF